MKPIIGKDVKPKAYPLMREAVEAGAAYGWHRAHKHTDAPTEEQAVQAITDAVLFEIDQRFDFDVLGDE